MDAFAAWVEHLFDRAPDEFEPVPWYVGDSRPTEWTLHYEEGDTPAAQAERIRRLFSHAGVLLRSYSDEQVGYGLDSLVWSAGGDIMVLGDSRVPSALRAAGLRAVVTLFAEVFAPRLAAAPPDWGRRPVESPQPGQPTDKLGYVCFMFWDIAPIVPGREDCEDTDREVIRVLEATLALDSAACQRAALHGLGHWQRSAPEAVSRIVRRWLQGHPQAPAKLRAYAVQASAGRVL
jgi:hypothetical protein